VRLFAGLSGSRNVGLVGSRMRGVGYQFQVQSLYFYDKQKQAQNKFYLIKSKPLNKFRSQKEYYE
jgi:hypothetical protein